MKIITKKSLLTGLCLFVLTFGMVLSAFALPQKRITLVLFCAKWNLVCRNANQVVENVAKAYGDQVLLRELDVDSSTTPDAARQIGISVPRTIPYIVVIDNNGKILGQRPYNRESVQELKGELDPIILPNL